MQNLNLFLSGAILATILTNSVISSVISRQRSNSLDGEVSNFLNPYDLHSNASKAIIRAMQSGLMKNYMNTSEDPCDNFYDYACGNWEKHNPIPKDKAQYTTTLLLQGNLEKKLKELLSEPLGEENPPSALTKAKMLYKTCLDEKAQTNLGKKQLLKFIEELGGWPVLDGNLWKSDKFDWVQLAANTSFIRKGIMIAFDVIKNPTVPNEYTIFLKQTTLAMTNRDNYLKKENSKNLEAYRTFIKKILQLLDVDEQRAQNVSSEIVDFEILLANATLPLEASKTESYYQVNVSEVIKAYKYIDWVKYFKSVKGTDVQMNDTVVMHLSIKYLENLADLLMKTKKKTLANYMIWRCVLYFITDVDNNFRAALNELFKTVTGEEEPTPLWKICVNQVNLGMGMATSGMFIRKYFDEYSKNESIKMINSLKEAFDENLLELDWIDAATKDYARKKADAMNVAAGYPDYVLSDKSLDTLYKDVQVVAGHHFENILSLSKFNWRKGRDRLFKPYDRNSWVLPPTIVNALYDFHSNRILVLAGLLQPPVFHKYHPQSLNYGAIGLFLGHELVHGFDDMGRNYDLQGIPVDWWTKNSSLLFDEKKKCFLDQYEEFAKRDESFKSIATISENIADNGGLVLAYKAYSKWKQSNAQLLREETFSNMKFNEDQLFFLSFAQSFCAATRPEALLESKSYKTHSPEKYRILGALMNFEKFAETFNCPVGSQLNPRKKCRLW